MCSETPKRAAMAAAVSPSSASARNATTWSAGCIAARTTFSTSESSRAASRVGLDTAGHRVVGTEHAGGGERLRLGEAPAAGDHREAALRAGAHDEVLDDAVGGDGRLELGIGRGARGRRAHVLGRELEEPERHVLEVRLSGGWLGGLHGGPPWEVGEGRRRRAGPLARDPARLRPRPSAGLALPAVRGTTAGRGHDGGARAQSVQRQSMDSEANTPGSKRSGAVSAATRSSW